MYLDGYSEDELNDSFVIVTHLVIALLMFAFYYIVFIAFNRHLVKKKQYSIYIFLYINIFICIHFPTALTLLFIQNKL